MSRSQQRPRSRRFWMLTSSALVLVLAAGGATAWALDRFVIQHVQVSDVAAYEAAQGVTATTSAVLESMT